MSKDQYKPIKQCILIAETLSSDYKTADAFQKIGHIPVIELVLSWLAEHGVSEIFICHSNQREHLRQYYQGIQKQCESKLQPVFMHPDNLKNFGEVMRNVQFRGLITEEFIVMHADTVTNLDLSKAVATHFKNKKELKNVVMSTVMRQGGEDTCIHLTNSETGEILQITHDNGTKLTLNTERIKLKKMNVELRRDLTYCGIYICSIDVLNSFKEIHDYCTMFDYIEAMLTSQVFDEKIVAYTLEGSELSFRTNTAKEYYLAYLNYVCKHFSPYTLFNQPKFPKWTKIDDTNISYFASAFNKILSNSSVISRTASISSNCYIGSNTQVGDRVNITKSVIGDNCIIEENTTIKNCIILDDCFIEKGGRYQNCLIEKDKEIQHVKTFAFSSFKGFLVERPLFVQTPENEEELMTPDATSTTGPSIPVEDQGLLEGELENMMAEDPELEIITQLYTVRKRLNRSLEDFTKAMIKVRGPKGVKGVQQFSEKWGEIILNLHDKQQKSVIDSLYRSCIQLPEYEKAFHVFLQFFYGLDHLSNFSIRQWYEAIRKENPDCPTLEKCEGFIEKLKEEEDQDDDESSGNDESEDSK